MDSNKIRNERRDITTDMTDIKRMISGYSKHLYGNKLDNQQEMDKFLETYILARLNHDEI